MLCKFEQVSERDGNGLATFRCTVCGRGVWRCKSPAEKIYARCGPSKKPPTLLEMMASAATAAANFAISGGKTIAKEAQEIRQSTCNTCPSHDSTANRCNECGCFLQLKTYLPDEKCPAGKW